MSNVRPVITRRGAFLLLLGLIYTILGFAYALPAVDTGSTNAYTAALALAPMTAWGSIWAACGIGAAVTAWWPREKDTWGFIILAWWSSMWATMGFCSTVFYASQRGWVAGLVWLTFAGVIVIVSGMDRPLRSHNEGDGRA